MNVEMVNDAQIGRLDSEIGTKIGMNALLACISRRAWRVRSYRAYGTGKTLTALEWIYCSYTIIQRKYGKTAFTLDRLGGTATTFRVKNDRRENRNYFTRSWKPSLLLQAKRVSIKRWDMEWSEERIAWMKNVSYWAWRFGYRLKTQGCKWIARPNIIAGIADALPEACIRVTFYLIEEWLLSRTWCFDETLSDYLDLHGTWTRIWRPTLHLTIMVAIDERLDMMGLDIRLDEDFLLYSRNWLERTLGETNVTRTCAKLGKSALLLLTNALLTILPMRLERNWPLWTVLLVLWFGLDLVANDLILLEYWDSYVCTTAYLYRYQGLNVTIKNRLRMKEMNEADRI